LDVTHGELEDAEILLSKQLDLEEQAKREAMWKRRGKKKIELVEQMEEQVSSLNRV
jgi:hypothetical protein